MPPLPLSPPSFSLPPVPPNETTVSKELHRLKYERYDTRRLAEAKLFHLFTFVCPGDILLAGLKTDLHLFLRRFQLTCGRRDAVVLPT